MHKNNCWFFRNRPLEDRIKESKKMRDAYPDKIPIIIDNEKRIENITKFKFLIPGTLNVSNLLNCIRNIIKLDKDKAIFIFVGNNTIPSTTSSINGIYQEYADEDGFLYVKVFLESTFG